MTGKYIGLGGDLGEKEENEVVQKLQLLYKKKDNDIEKKFVSSTYKVWEVRYTGFYSYFEL